MKTAAVKTRRGQATRCRRSCCPTSSGRLVSLESLLAEGPVAVMFHRGHWCPYCRLNVRAVVQAQGRIKALGGHVVAIMPELQQFTTQFKADSGAPFPVLTDIDNGYALSLNLAIWLDAEIQQLLSYQDLSSFHGNDGWMLPIPATFVVGRDGLVKARFVDPDFRKRMEIDDLHRRVQGCVGRISRRRNPPRVPGRYASRNPP